MSGDARMFARERIYRYTNVYIIKVGVITSFVSPDVKSTTPSQHVRRSDCFPAIFIKSGVWLAKRDIRTPRSPHRFHGALQLNVADGSWLAGNDKKGWQCVNVATFSVCVFRARVQIFHASHFLDGFFKLKDPSFPDLLAAMQAIHGSCFWLKDSTHEAKAAKSEKKKADKEGVLKGWAWELKMAQDSPEGLYGIWTTLMSKERKNYVSKRKNHSLCVVVFFLGFQNLGRKGATWNEIKIGRLPPCFKASKYCVCASQMSRGIRSWVRQSLQQHPGLWRLVWCLMESQLFKNMTDRTYLDMLRPFRGSFTWLPKSVVLHFLCIETAKLFRCLLCLWGINDWFCRSQCFSFNNGDSTFSEDGC